MEKNPNNYKFEGDGKETNSKKIKRALVTIKASAGPAIYNEIHIYKNLGEIKKELSKKFPKGTMVFLNRGDYHKTVQL